jgi:DNA-binding transcriptional MerR regulator
MGEELLTIGELAARTGVATSALRYYEELGLVRSVTRVSGHRRYPPEAVGTVGAILFLRDVGFTASRGDSPRAWHELARRKLQELDERIHQAEVAKVAVEHALECPRDDIVTCPNFQEVVRQRLAGKRLEDVRL